ncbi:MAG: N-acetylglucosamine kinase [Brachybacterium sp.]|uniref:N-acetylglucosamine kinase n=1 Tax=Brachybacterium sp. TaxID=1891286 RepID=UPI00264775CA|nr:BadF/BadG/BcrA/BcrD ATPase family protein [Brachybacterium sp.]MDN5685978.1 N-acetylglucosamine kinase [Brachybacterium sp.]
MDADASRPTRVVIAGDIGGTRSRLVLAPLRGEVTAEAEGPGANLRSSGSAALDHLADTVAAVLEDGRHELGDGIEVAAVALGISGAGPARAREVAAAVGERLERLGISEDRLLVTDDLHTAFLAGGVGDDGLLVLAGTGAVAVRFRRREAVARRDGMGWLLGDIGSAVWLGRRTLQAVAADLDGRGRRTHLTEQVADMLDLDLRDGLLPPSPTGDPRQDLIRALDECLPAGAPAALGRFARLPGTVPEDPAAREILDTAVRHVMDTVRALDPEAGLPVVLAGSVLATPGPIHDEITTGLEADGRSFTTASSGLPGALLLARERAGDDLG